VVRRIRPLASVRAGVAACLAGFVLLGRIGSVAGLYAAATCLAATSATVVTGLNALSSLEAGAGERGGKLGNLRRWGQLGRGLGPLLFTSVYWWAGREVAYGMGALAMAGVGLLVTFGLRAPPGSDGARRTTKGEKET